MGTERFLACSDEALFFFPIYPSSLHVAARLQWMCTQLTIIFPTWTLKTWTSTPFTLSVMKQPLGQQNYGGNYSLLLALNTGLYTHITSYWIHSLSAPPFWRWDHAASVFTRVVPQNNNAREYWRFGKQPHNQTHWLRTLGSAKREISQQCFTPQKKREEQFLSHKTSFRVRTW